MACGRRSAADGFEGAAPQARLCVVKCRPAGQSLKAYYGIDPEVLCYSEADIMMAARFISRAAYDLMKPVVILLGVGTNLGSHGAGGALGEQLRYLGDFRGCLVVLAAGNEGDKAHHVKTRLLMQEGARDLKLQVEKKKSFTTELWSDIPSLYSVGFVTPSGEYAGRTIARPGAGQSIRFVLERTRIEVAYLPVSDLGGDTCLQIRFFDAEPGLWTIRIFLENGGDTGFDLWLPIEAFVGEDVIFVQPEPDDTICESGNQNEVITVTGYDGYTGAQAVFASRGYARFGGVKPDLAAPAVRVYGPVAGRNGLGGTGYTYRSGTSNAAALAAGAAALLGQWALLQGRDINLDTPLAGRYLIRGARRPASLEWPNTIWGYGLLDLYGVFEGLRPLG